MNKKFGIFLLVIVGLFFFRIWEKSIIFSDELLIVDTVKSMAESNSWLIPLVNHSPNLEKPPLVFWLATLLYKAIPLMPFSGRLLMVLFGIGLVTICFKFTSEKFNQKTAIWASAFTAFSFEILYFTKTINIDLPNAFFTLLAIWIYSRPKKNPKLYFLTGLIIGLSILTRSFLAFYPLLYIFIDWVTGIRPKVKDIYSLIGASGIISLPWLVIAYLSEPTAFVNGLINLPLKFHILSIVPGSVPSNGLFYLNLLLLCSGTLFAIIQIWTWTKHKPNPTEKNLGIWLILSVILLSIFPEKHEWYTIPLIPVISILGARCVTPIMEIKIPSLATAIIQGSIVILLLWPVTSLLTQPLPQSGIISATNTLKMMQSPNDCIRVYKYPLIPETTDYPGTKICIMTEEYLRKNSAIKTNLIIRNIDLRQLPKNGNIKLIQIYGEYSIIQG